MSRTPVLRLHVPGIKIHLDKYSVNGRRTEFWSTAHARRSAIHIASRRRRYEHHPDVRVHRVVSGLSVQANVKRPASLRPTWVFQTNSEKGGDSADGSEPARCMRPT